jgi:hypothetical protein
MPKFKLALFLVISCALHVSFGCNVSSVKTDAPAEDQTKTEKNFDSDAAPISASGQAAATQSGGRRFRGIIGDGNRIEMTLRRDGNQLAGSYFYAKSGSANPLQLKGTIDAGGKFRLQEFDRAGKQTGEFTGEWADAPNEPGATLSGEWRKPKAKDGQNFWAYEQMIDASAYQITSKRFGEENKAKRFEIGASYPEITNAENAAKFNQLAKDAALKPVEGFKKNMLEQTDEDLSYLPEGVSNFMEIDYNVELANDDFLSIQFQNTAFTGGAHPNHYFSSLNYDLKSGREIKLAELFKPDADYLKFLSEYAIAELKKPRKDYEPVDDEWLRTGAGPDDENYSTWNLTRKGLMITFDHYAVAPYAAGEQTVIVPFAKLKQIARADGALAKLAK